MSFMVVSNILWPARTLQRMVRRSRRSRVLPRLLRRRPSRIATHIEIGGVSAVALVGEGVAEGRPRRGRLCWNRRGARQARTCLSKAVRSGWLDNAVYGEVASRGYQGLLQELVELRADGDLDLKNVRKVAAPRSGKLKCWIDWASICPSGSEPTASQGPFVVQTFEAHLRDFRQLGELRPLYCATSARPVARLEPFLRLPLLLTWRSVVRASAARSR